MILNLVISLLLAPIVLVLVFLYRRNLIFGSKSRILGDQRPSFTAELVCAYRAVGYGLKWCNDPFAYFMLDFDAKLIVMIMMALKRLLGHRLSMVRVAYLAARTEYLDKFILTSNCQQVVILGAGLDARAYRLRRELGPDVKFFEVDAPATQHLKVKLMRELVTTNPELFDERRYETYVKYVSCDFSSESFIKKLEESNCDLTNPRTVVLLEGVASYLTREAFVETLKAVASFAPGTKFAMNLLADEARKKSLVSKFLKFFVGEEWKNSWGKNDSPTEFFEPLGFQVLEAKTFPEVIAETATLRDENFRRQFPGMMFALQIK